MTTWFRHRTGRCQVQCFVSPALSRSSRQPEGVPALLAFRIGDPNALEHPRPCFLELNDGSAAVLDVLEVKQVHTDAGLSWEVVAALV